MFLMTVHKEMFIPRWQQDDSVELHTSQIIIQLVLSCVRLRNQKPRLDDFNFSRAERARSSFAEKDFIARQIPDTHQIIPKTI